MKNVRGRNAYMRIFMRKWRKKNHKRSLATAARGRAKRYRTKRYWAERYWAKHCRGFAGSHGLLSFGV